MKNFMVNRMTFFYMKKKRALRRALSELAGDSHTYRHMKAVKNTASY